MQLTNRCPFFSYLTFFSHNLENHAVHGKKFMQEEEKKEQQLLNERASLQ
jgi:hypothetical protein